MESLDQLKEHMRCLGVTRLYAKRLSPNDNSKNQVYLGSNFDVLNLFPNLDIVSDPSAKNYILKSSLNFSWLSDEGEMACSASHAQLILYPQYPEVRFSGFLKGCQESPSSLMTSRDIDRVLFFGVKPMGEIVGYVVSPEHPIAIETIEFQKGDELFIEISLERDSRSALIEELLRIHLKSWIDSKRLNKDRIPLPCRAPNCGGYTLEAELGITPNGNSKPDFLGWEVKQFKTTNIDKVKLGAKALTLMTPQPTGGFYKDYGVKDFVFKYGYDDKRGLPDRMNYGGTYYCDRPADATGHTLTISGFNPSSGSFDSPNEGLILKSNESEIIAIWSFEKLLSIWNRKHSKAVYVPSERRGNKDNYQFRYSRYVYLGEGTSFSRFLLAFQEGKVYYDPGIKVENISSGPTAKHRSQFRVKAKDLSVLYNQWEKLDLTD